MGIIKKKKSKKQVCHIKLVYFPVLQKFMSKSFFF